MIQVAARIVLQPILLKSQAKCRVSRGVGTDCFCDQLRVPLNGMALFALNTNGSFLSTYLVCAFCFAGQVPGAPAECVALAAQPVALATGRDRGNGFWVLRQEGGHQQTLIDATLFPVPGLHFVIRCPGKWGGGICDFPCVFCF